MAAVSLGGVRPSPRLRKEGLPSSMKKSCLSEDRILTRRSGDRGRRAGGRRLMKFVDGVESIWANDGLSFQNREAWFVCRPSRAAAALFSGHDFFYYA